MISIVVNLTSVLNPFSTSSGTCFTTDVELREEIPVSYSSFKVYLYIPEHTLLSPNMAIAAPGITESDGIIYALSAYDHPATALLNSPIKASYGTHNMIGIEKELV